MVHCGSVWLLVAISWLMTHGICASLEVGYAREAISEELLGNFKLYAQYAAAAYCVGNNDSPFSQVLCSSGNCPLVEAANANTTEEFQDTAIADTTGFIAVDPSNEVIVVAFRGSAQIKNWIMDFNLEKAFTDICFNCRAHAGFWQSWKEIRGVVFAGIKDAMDSNPGYQLVITGHSLGGAVATLAAADVRKGHTAATLYTYGAPRVGGGHLARLTEQQSGGSYRITHTDDMVPHLPSQVWSMTGYAHISPEYHIDQGDEADEISTGDITVDPLHEFSGDLHDALQHHWEAHRHYFGPTSACSHEHDKDPE
ncbi:MAG: hypothetical protein M1819_001552 [Sarea resinae]|nr:MAG: hypothetical protein M1819_001552 [Sarea resinae]